MSGAADSFNSPKRCRLEYDSRRGGMERASYYVEGILRSRKMDMDPTMKLIFRPNKDKIFPAEGIEPNPLGYLADHTATTPQPLPSNYTNL